MNHAVICEAAALAKRAGAGRGQTVRLPHDLYGYSKVLEVTYKGHIQPLNFENPTGMKMMCKDLTLAQHFAHDYGAQLPMTDKAMELYQKALDDGYDGCDQCVILKQLLQA